MRNKKYIDDVLSRAIKTFVQAFCGVLIPEIIALLNGNISSDQTLWVVLLPILASSFAAGLSACWNLINNKLLEDINQEENDK